jgi:hypothetical protein
VWKKKERGRQNVRGKKRIRDAMGEKKEDFNKLQVTILRNPNTVLSSTYYTNYGKAQLWINFLPHNKTKLSSEFSAIDRYPD